METMIHYEDFYDGSRILLPIAKRFNLNLEMVNFVFSQIVGLCMASSFRSTLQVSKVSAVTRHVFAMAIGIGIVYFCYGRQAVHIFALPIVCYIVMRIQGPDIVHRNVFIVGMGYLLSVHLVRQIYDFDCSSLDITGPMMIITEKVTSLGFSLHDGIVRKPENLTKAQKYHAVEKMPSMLEFFSYIWHFHCILAGPLVFYNDYIDFIEGTNYAKHGASNSNSNNGLILSVVQIREDPSPAKAVVGKVVGCVICAAVFMKTDSWYPVSALSNEAFLKNHTVVYKSYYVLLATTGVRFKYYHAWLLADAVCNSSGLGFAGYDKDENSKWDLVSNINVFGFEFSSNLREAISCWNRGTNQWLRMLVYERVPKEYGTALTFLLSAVWHGFYPGYYLTFGTAALMVEAARMARRMFRHRFQCTQYTRMFYDIVTCLTTRVVLAYTTFPFMMLVFYKSIALYFDFYLCLHFAPLIVIFILPHIIRAERRNEQVEDVSKSHLAKSTETLQPRINGGNDMSNGIADVLVPLCNEEDDELVLKKKLIKLPIRLVSSSPSESIRIQHDQCEMDQLSSRLKEKLDAEARSLEEFIDKTATRTMHGIVEFSNDLLRDISQETIGSPTSAGYRKRIVTNGSSGSPTSNNSDSAVFLKKEINAVVHQSNVLPAVISNGHAK